MANMHLRSWAEWPLVHIGLLPRPSSHDSLQWARQERIWRSDHTLATQNHNLFSMSYLENNPVKDILATLTSRGSCALCCQPNGISRIWYKPWKGIDIAWYNLIQGREPRYMRGAFSRSKDCYLLHVDRLVPRLVFSVWDILCHQWYVDSAPPTALIMCFHALIIVAVSITAWHSLYRPY